MSLKRLILIRHGKAEARAASGEDFDRALTERGQTDARETGRRLAEAGFAPDLALVSAATRASQTWDEAGRAFPDARVERMRSLYHEGPAGMLQAARAAGADCVAIVGHNPGMHALAFELVARGRAEPAVIRRLREGFPTACAVVFRLDDGGPVCEALISPKDEP
jgi:phosphohistidine phosphatase